MKTEKTSRRPYWLILIAVVILALITSVVAFAAMQNADNGGDAVVAQVDDGTSAETATSIYDQGVLVTGVSADKPAAEAGIRRGTIILSVNGTDVTTAAELSELVADAAENGGVVTMTVLNSAEPEEITITLADETPYLGVMLDGMHDFGRMQTECTCADGTIPALPHGGKGFGHGFTAPFGEGDFNFEAMTAGAMLMSVEPDSPAAAAGLEVGDIITAIDDTAVDSVDALVAAVAELTPGDRVTLTIQREGEEMSAILVLGVHPDDATRGFLGVSVGPSINIEQFSSGQLPEGALPFSLEELEKMFPEGFDSETFGDFFAPDGTIDPEALQEFFDSHFGENGAFNFHDLEKMFPHGFGGFDGFVPEFTPDTDANNA
ncbi:MAG: PDZ domain-containing protein [Anaerolineae bacterium]|nr:PDZ domain-containing protein [Anaerolineae bacterium]